MKNNKKAEVVTLPSIYDYNDFRNYLKDYFIARHNINKKFTWSSFCRLIGLPNTRSFIGDVIRGKKISDTFIERFIKVIGFDKDERNYFRILVKYNQATNPDEKMLYFEQLIRLNKVKYKTLDKKLFKYYSNWYNGVIRAMLDYIDFKDNYKDLAHRLIPSITVREVKEAINLLKELKLVKTDENGFLKPTEKSIAAPEYIKDELIRNYHITCAELSRLAVIMKFKEPHLIATNTISTSMEGLKMIEKIIHRFRAEIRACVNRDPNKAETTYQLNIFLFPCCRKEK
ncbi:MAG: TIGR02147 family protein [Chitinispirillaceae bacterium]|nr:TIGR02147 family protein [Chitinispirillaceae bacterium]